MKWRFVVLRPKLDGAAYPIVRGRWQTKENQPYSPKDALEKFTEMMSLSATKGITLDLEEGEFVYIPMELMVQCMLKVEVVSDDL